MEGYVRVNSTLESKMVRLVRDAIAILSFVGSSVRGNIANTIAGYWDNVNGSSWTKETSS